MGVAYHERQRKRTKYESERKQIAHYRNRYDEVNECFNIQYSMPNHGWGRIIADDNLTLSVMKRQTRHTFCKDNYVDIDMINCHMSFFLAFAKHHNMKYTVLNQYCSDPKAFRELIINIHLPHMSYIEAKDIAKTLPIMLVNGGMYDTWKKDNNIDVNIKSSMILQLERELKDIATQVLKHNPQIIKDVLKANPKYFHDGKKTKIKTCVALWAQTLERYILEDAITYIVDKYDIEIEDIVPCQDGLMIHKDVYHESMLTHINNYINTVYPYNIFFNVKEFDECISIPKHSALDIEIRDIVRVYDETNFFDFDYSTYIDLGDMSEIKIDYDDFHDANTFIIKSGTGTGKSKIVCSLINQYLEKNTEKRVLVMANLISILHEIAKKFKKNHNLTLKSYKEYDEEDIISNNSYICSNSIDYLDNMDFSNTVLYIDEPTNFLMNMVDNDTYSDPMITMNVFYQMIRSCDKLVLTDAHHTILTNRILKIRGCPEDKLYYYINTHKKYKNATATHVQDENEFLNILIEKVKKGEKFIFASDTKTAARSFMLKCMQYADDEDKERFYLIAKDENTDINNIDVNNSYIFMSPKITCGVSIETNKEIQLDSFIHVSGTTINPITCTNKLHETVT